MFNRNIPYNDLPLLPPDFNFDDVALLKLVNKANNSLFELKGMANVLPNSGILVSPLSIREAVASSGIENINTTVAEALKADVIYEESEKVGAEKEILNYRDALREGYKLLKKDEFLNSNSFIKIQSILEPNKSGIRKVPGVDIRSSKTGEIIYTPPEGHDVILNKLKNFEDYFNDGKNFYDVDPLVRMAIMHYQLEAIHPFLDGNGRTGRIVMILYLVLTKRLELPILFLSKYILENRDEYYKKLRGVTEEGRWMEWVCYILQGVDLQAQETTKNIFQIKSLIENYKKIAYRDGTKITSQMLDYLFSNPFYSQKNMADSLKVHRNTAAKYFQELEEAGIVKKFKHKQGYVYYNQKFLKILSY
jgi:Fic family protein